jgi:hypothetical protein
MLRKCMRLMKAVSAEISIRIGTKIHLPMLK